MGANAESGESDLGARKFGCTRLRFGKSSETGRCMEILIVIWLLFGIASAVVMSNKGRSGCGGFALGFLLGPFGLIIALVLPADRMAQEKKDLRLGQSKKCPQCAELIKVEAKKCRHCGAELYKPMTPDLAEQLQFSAAELDCYGHKQLAALDGMIKNKDVSAQQKACDAICSKIGRVNFEGPPKDFLVAYRQQLQTHIDGKQG